MTIELSSSTRYSIEHSMLSRVIPDGFAIPSKSKMIEIKSYLAGL